MGTPRRLKTRLVIACTAFGFLVSGIFALASLNVRSRVEGQLVSAALQQDADAFARRSFEDPGKPYQGLVQAWAYRQRNLYKAPMAWQTLKPGVYDRRDPLVNGIDRQYKLAVGRYGDVTVYLTYDVSRGGLGKRQLIVALSAAVFFLTILSFALGLGCSRIVLRPLEDLNRRVRLARSSTQVVDLSPHFIRDEVGELARTLHEYASELTEVVRRDMEFNADVSHELRTPMTIIATSTELLLGSERDHMSPRGSQRLHRIDQASRRASEVIEALLLLSRPKSGIQASASATDVGEIAKELIGSLPGTAPSPAVSVSVREPSLVFVPRSVVAVILSNLVGNAIKFSPEGSVEVVVDAHSVSVYDSGPGVDPETSRRLFERGTRAHSDAIPGAGLGLAIVRRLCDRYDWSVSLRPRVDGRGSVAAVRFSGTSHS